MSVTGVRGHDHDGPRLTVGIPTFNRSAWLRETIASVLAQTFSDFRVIVSDNASQDDTAAVVAGFADSRIQYRRNTTNIGSIANLNLLVSLADTEFLMLLPDDDLLAPGHLRAAVEALERFTTAGLVHSAFTLIDARSQELRTMRPLRGRADGAMLEAGGDALRRMMVESWPLCFSSVVYRTAAIAGAGAIPDAGPFADLQLWLRMARDWDLAYLTAPLARFRLHQQSTSAQAGGQGLGAPDPLQLMLRHAQMRHEQRVLFLESTDLAPALARSLRALAELDLTVAGDHGGRPRREAIGRLAGLVRSSPAILLAPSLWRFALALLGGSRTRAAARAGLRSLRRRPAPRASGAQRPARATDRVR